MTGPVRLLISRLVEAPAVVGLLKPVVLAPVGALAGLPAEQMAALLLHELAHIRRYDYVVNVVQSIAESLLFYHPAVWWVSGHIRAEREICCDDVAVAVTGDALSYAIALADLALCGPVDARCAVAANGGRLVDRIARLIGQDRPESSMFTAPGVASAALLAIGACLMFGQSVERLKFEVASVKASPKLMNYSSLRPEPGGRLHAENLTVRQYIKSAYSLQDFQVVGGPAWLRNEGFDIEAKGDAGANREKLMLMLQPLLEERFQLKYHRETRELPVYALTVAKGGAKLPGPKEGGCAKMDGTTPPFAGRPTTPCGSLFAGFGSAGVSGGMTARGGDLDMPYFVRFLSSTLGRPVLDRTGIAKHFDVQLNFAVDDSVAGVMDGGAVAGHTETMAAAAAAPGGAPNILAALQEQLGLKLEATKGPVEVMVIDHVEKPAGN